MVMKNGKTKDGLVRWYGMQPFRLQTALDKKLRKMGQAELKVAKENRKGEMSQFAAAKAAKELAKTVAEYDQLISQKYFKPDEGTKAEQKNGGKESECN